MRIRPAFFVLLSLSVGLLGLRGVRAQQPTISAPESIVADGVPAVPASLAETADRYLNYRLAFDADWHPTRREMLIGTRFGDTYELHLVKSPGAARQQLTFFREPVRVGSFHPAGGDYIVFRKDVGGGEWYQLYRYDMVTGESTLLTDGKSRNSLGPWSTRGDRIAYTSTRRTGQDTDLWVMNPADPKTDRLLTQLNGGGWEPEDWSPDDKHIVMVQEISATESHLWLVDTASGEKSELTPDSGDDKVAYGNARFSKDGKGVYFTSDKDSEFQRLTYMDLASNKKVTVLTADVPWDVMEFAISYDGKRIAFITNEDGQAVLRLLDTASGKEVTSRPENSGGMGGGASMASK